MSETAEGTGDQRRRDLILEIERLRESRVVTYVLSDRQGAAAQIADDAVRPLYDHLRAMGKCERLDLFLYSIGGLTEVPWRIVSMIREYADEFSVLISYRAMSAATMVAIGADHIVMGPKGELGPIDPQLGFTRDRDGQTPVQEQIAVEDIMSYLRLLREKVGLSDQAALAAPIAVLAEKLDPVVLGIANRAHSHIRLVARKLLASRKNPFDEQVTGLIIETLAEKTYQHGHAIGRHEARAIGLDVVNPDDDLEAAMWSLLEEYEDLLVTRLPVDPESALVDDVDRGEMPVALGAIESGALAHRINGTIHIQRKRQIPSQLQMNVQLSLNLPPGIDPATIPAAAQQALQAMIDQAQQGVAKLVQEEIRKQAPVVGIEGRLRTSGWAPVSGWVPA
jgi:hypothetical protein